MKSHNSFYAFFFGGGETQFYMLFPTLEGHRYFNFIMRTDLGTADL